MYRPLGLNPPAALDAGAATAYDYVYAWQGGKWVLERDGWVTDARALYHGGDGLEQHPYQDVLKQYPPPYRAIVRYYLAEQNGKQVWQRLAVDTNY